MRLKLCFVPCWRCYAPIIILGLSVLFTTACQRTAAPQLPSKSPALRAAADAFLYRSEALRYTDANTTAALRGQLLAGNFQAVEITLNAIDREFQRDAAYEFVYEDAVHLTASCTASDDSISYALQRWSDKTPNSAWPHVLLGYCYRTAGWSVRGSGWASEVSHDQQQALDNFQRRALGEYNEALRLNPKMWPIYTGLIDITRSYGDFSGATRAFQMGRHYVPRSYLIPFNYMEAMEPRWLGNYAQMRQLATDMRPHVDQNPRFYDLQGMAAADQGDMAYRDRNFQAAFADYQRALQYEDYPSWIEWAGESLMALRQYGAAQQYFLRYQIYKPGEYVNDRLNWLDAYCTRSPRACPYSAASLPWYQETAPGKSQ